MIGTSNMIAGISSEYSNMAWKTVKEANAMDLGQGKFINTNTGTIQFPGMWGSCAIGSNYAGS